MNKLQALTLILLILTTSVSLGQNKNANLGFKAGANYGKYTPNQNSIAYKYQLGFYAGGFYRIQVADRWEFQPELLFALQGSKVITKDNEITDFSGNPLSNTSTFDFEYEVYELTLSIPLVFKFYLSKDFYLESGPQLGFILDRNLSSSQYLLDGNDNSFVKQDGDNFDFGFSFGTGYNLSQNITLNLRAFSSLIKRDDKIKAFILNFGIEYNL